MQVRIDRDIAKKVKAAMKKSGRSAAREVSMALAIHYERERLSGMPNPASAMELDPKHFK